MGTRLVTRTIFAEVPPRVEYRVTYLGRTLGGPVMALAGWAADHQLEIGSSDCVRAAWLHSDVHPIGSGPRCRLGHSRLSPTIPVFPKRIALQLAGLRMR